MSQDFLDIDLWSWVEDEYFILSYYYWLDVTHCIADFDNICSHRKSLFPSKGEFKFNLTH